MILTYRKYLLYFLVLMYVSGAIGFTYNPSFFIPFTPFTLLFTCFVFLIYQPLNDLKFVLSFAAIAWIGFCTEVIGVKTGWIFGDYTYGKSLGIKLFDVPVTISLNWALIATASILASQLITKNKLLSSILAASFATTIDLLIEQVAPLLDFWRFNGGAPTIHNYLGWFVISFLVAILFHKPLLQGNRKMSVALLILQVLFFGIIYLLN